MMIGRISTVILVLAGGALAFTGCERHSWEESTDVLFKPHGKHAEHGDEHEGGHDGDASKHGSSPEDAGPGKATPKDEAQAKDGAGQGAEGRTVFGTRPQS